jgi:hypothetical protein
MKELIEALQILLRYGNPTYPTSCIHDELIVHGIDPKLISEEDVNRLGVLGFYVQIEGVWDSENEFTPDEDRIYSFKYGSC